MVMPQFPKRGDAKRRNAECLAALALGVGEYVRAIGAAIETKISPKTKTPVYEGIIPLLNTGSIGQMFEYAKDRDGTCDLYFVMQ